MKLRSKADMLDEGRRMVADVVFAGNESGSKDVSAAFGGRRSVKAVGSKKRTMKAIETRHKAESIRLLQFDDMVMT